MIKNNPVLSGLFFLSKNASTYDSCSSCSGLCTSNCMWNSIGSGAPNYNTTCGLYGCYTGGCYLGCTDDCKGTCFDGKNCTGQSINFNSTGNLDIPNCASCTAPSYCKNYTRADALSCNGLATFYLTSNKNVHYFVI